MTRHIVAESIQRTEGGLQESKEKGSIVHGGHGEKLSRLMEGAILALIECRTQKEAAQRIGIAESTLRSWSRDPVFREHYDATRRHILEVGTTQIADLKLEALGVLGDELRDASNPAIRHDAAKFALALPDRELQRLDAERRFTALREETADKKRGNMTILEILKDCGLGINGFLDLLSAALEQVRPEGTCCEEDTPAVETSSSQIIADHRDGQDSGDETNVVPGDGDREQRGSSAQIIADHRVGDDEERGGATTAEPTTGDEGRSAQIGADAREKDHHTPNDTTKEDGGDEDLSRPVIHRRLPLVT